MKFMLGSKNKELKGALKKAIDGYLDCGMLDELQEDIWIVLSEESFRLHDKAEMYSKAAKRFESK